jgi:hypothetical protein
LKEVVIVAQSVSLPSFRHFVDHIQKHFAQALPGSKVLADNFGLVVVQGDRATTLSLDKLYRFYVDNVTTHPDLSEEQLTDALKQLVNKYLVDTRRNEIFQVTREPTSALVVEQCCVR